MVTSRDDVVDPAHKCMRSDVTDGSSTNSGDLIMPIVTLLVLIVASLDRLTVEWVQALRRLMQ